MGIKLNILKLGCGLFLALLSQPAWTCVDQEEIQRSGQNFQTHILFHKEGEYYALQQHLIYYQNRPYFNYSLCSKKAGSFGYQLSEASHYDFEQDCDLLGSWLPVYGPRGEEVFVDYFFNYFSQYLDEYTADLIKRDKLSPVVNGLTNILTDIDNLLVTTAGALLVRQAYIAAPLANTVGRGNGGRGRVRTLRTGWLFMFMGALGFATQTYKQERSSRAHRDQLQEAITTMDRTLREAEIMQNSEVPKSDLRSYATPLSIIDRIIPAFAKALAQMNRHQKWVCDPMVPADVLELENQFKQEI